MERKNIDKIAQTPEDRLLLARLWDKLNVGLRRNIPASTCFLSPREQELARLLFGAHPGLHRFGGYPEAERRMLVFLPEYLGADWLMGEDSPMVCIRATFYEADDLSHRDFLGALMGAGIARETLGDILVGKGSCDFFLTAEIAPYVLQSFTDVGRTRVHLTQIPLNQVQPPQPQLQQVRDTLASARLDSVISSGFRIGRTLAAAHISAGKCAVNGLSCLKPDKLISPGDQISVRGLGKIRLTQINGQTRKGRISVVIDRYV